MLTRQRVLVVAIATALSTFSGACKDKKEEAKPAPGAPGAATKADGTPAKKLTGAAAQHPDLDLLPVDSELVLGVNWGQLQASPLWKKFVEPEMLKDKDFTQGMAQFKDRCGFDPFLAVQKMSVGLKGLDADKPDGVIIVHGPDKAKTLACLDKWQAEAAKEDITIKKDGDVVLATSDGETVAMTFLSESTALVVIGVNATAEGVKKIAAGGSTLSTSAAFVDMFGKVKTGDSLWALVNGNSKLFEDAGALGIKPKAVFGSVNVTDSVNADVRARLDSPDTATTTANGLRGQAAAMESMVDKLEITNDGADVRLVAAASSQKLEALMKMFAE
ncbi:MAG: hypothetical protein H0T89_33485 [Deltaproteobacteria bacterium]|nr:hypothetical protein [Deltaproteobacteria bacterium]